MGIQQVWMSVFRAFVAGGGADRQQPEPPPAEVPPAVEAPAPVDVPVDPPAAADPPPACEAPPPVPQAPAAKRRRKAPTAVQRRDDPALAALRDKLAAAVGRLDDLSARKADIDQTLLAFQIAQYEALGPTLEACLALRCEYLQLKAERSGAAADIRAAREAAAEYEACQMASDGDEALHELDDAARAELRQRYRSAAMRCHPDRVAEADQPAAAALFVRVQQAYRSADLPALRALCRGLDAGNAGAADGRSGDGADELRRRLNEVHDQTADLMVAIQTARLDPQYRQAYHPEDWAALFAATRTRLESECDTLRWQIRGISRG